MLPSRAQTRHENLPHVQGVQAHPYWWGHCAHPTHHHGEHKAPLPTHDLHFELRDAKTKKVVPSWVPGQAYTVTVSAPVEFQAFVTITGGALLRPCDVLPQVPAVLCERHSGI